MSTIDPPLSGRWNKDRRIALAIDMLLETQPSRWITHRFELDKAQQAYELLDDPAALQILLTYGDEGVEQ